MINDFLEHYPYKFYAIFDESQMGIFIAHKKCADSECSFYNFLFLKRSQYRLMTSDCH